MRAALLLWIGFLTLGAPLEAPGDEGSFNSSVVKVTATRRGPNPVQPWTKAAPSDVSGTGFVIDGERLLTNAHVVEYATQIYVQPDQSAEKFEATVETVSYEMDMAVLKVAEAGFFDSRPAIPMTPGLPKLKSPVNVYGYPVGGEQMSITEGIISRVDFTAYGTGGAGLRIQIDAAINPGNSGGPAITDGKLLGVAFQVLRQAENVGYIIPTEEVLTFLEDAKDGTYDGKPQLIAEMQTVENDALRARLGLARGMGGSMLTRPHEVPNSPLQVGDVITHIGDQPIDQNSKVKINDELTLPFNYLVPKFAQNGTVKAKVLRQGQPLDVEIPTNTRDSLIVPPLRGTYPRYFIFGPLVFSTVTRELMGGLGPGGGGGLFARRSPILTRMFDRAKDDEELVVIASPMFAHKSIKGYSQPFGACVSSVNSTPVRNLKHLVELLRDAEGEFLEIEFVDRQTERLVFRRQELIDATDEILSDNGIRRQYSEDLEGVWKKTSG